MNDFFTLVRGKAVADALRYGVRNAGAFKYEFPRGAWELKHKNISVGYCQRGE